MKVQVTAGDITATQADAIVVNLFQGVKAPAGATGAVDQALDGSITKLIEQGEIKGKAGELTLLHTFGKIDSLRVIIAGLGKSEKFDIDGVRATAAGVARFARKAGARTLATIVHGAGIGGLDPELAAEAVVEGSLMGAYRFLRHKEPDEDAKELDELWLIERDESRLPALSAAAGRAEIMARASALCRDMANEPANYLTPTDMAQRAEELAAEAGLTVEVYDREWMESKGMGAFLGVASGSLQPPKFIVLRYDGAPGAETLAYVGKGITFDSGGISIKPAAKMEEMKGDMSGGAAVICALWAIGKLGLPLNVVGLVPATENLPSGTALKPGDVVKAMNGKTIEVINTDAEGRLVLADGLSYAQELGAAEVVDIATLTGAATYALGPYAAGILGNDDGLRDRIMEAGKAAGERFWPMPMFDDYDDLIKSDVADVKNTGGAPGGMTTAARFLKKFAGDKPWAHLDIASVDVASSDKGVLTKGATGFGVRTLIQYARQKAQRAASTPA
ncbi:MAG: leucyl aminopeptidase [Dehalococcoidia bacterium]